MNNSRTETPTANQPPKKRRHPLDRHRKAKMLESYIYQLRDLADSDPSKTIPCGLATAKIMQVLNQVHERDLEERVKEMEAQVESLLRHLQQMPQNRYGGVS